MITTFLLSILLIFRSYLKKSKVQFSSEVVSIELFRSRAITRGVYNFNNSSVFSRKQSIRYPFPQTNFEVLSVRFNNEAQEYKTRENALYFDIEVKPFRTNTLVVEYSETISDSYEYILTTTKSWEKPLDRADFNIQLYDNLELIESNYELESISSDKFKMSELEFSPENNLIIKLE